MEQLKEFSALLGAPGGAQSPGSRRRIGRNCSPLGEAFHARGNNPSRVKSQAISPTIHSQRSRLR